MREQGDLVDVGLARAIFSTRLESAGAGFSFAGAIFDSRLRKSGRCIRLAFAAVRPRDKAARVEDSPAEEPRRCQFQYCDHTFYAQLEPNPVAVLAPLQA